MKIKQIHSQPQKRQEGDAAFWKITLNNISQQQNNENNCNDLWTAACKIIRCWKLVHNTVILSINTRNPELSIHRDESIIIHNQTDK